MEKKKHSAWEMFDPDDTVRRKAIERYRAEQQEKEKPRYEKIAPEIIQRQKKENPIKKAMTRQRKLKDAAETTTKVAGTVVGQMFKPYLGPETRRNMPSYVPDRYR